MQTKGKYFFTSESVTEGHPDKVADQISDAVLDTLLEQDPDAHVACETLVTTGMAVIAGEITTKGYADLPKVVRQTIREIGYTSSDMGFDADTCAVISSIDHQSPDIAQGVLRALPEEQGAGDQGMMFGFACNETATLMPAAIYYAHQLMLRQSKLRRDGTMPYLRPDAKSQVTLRYENGKPVAADTIVLSTQHSPEWSDGMSMKPEFIEAVIENIIRPVMPAEWLKGTKFLVNPTGRFVVGGPQGDCGLTGRKIIVDTYGGSCPHGGGAFSGKDPTKVDRSAAYACRYVAKNIVAAGLASRCQVQVAYAIGVAEPMNITVRTMGTGKVSDDALSAAVRKVFDLRPGGILQMLDLRRPIYSKTAAYGHFGREEPEFTWEKTDKADILKGMFC